MIPIEQMRQLLTVHEGYREKPYRCTAGYLTIGVGRNLDAKGLRPDEIKLMLDNDIEEAEGDAKWVVPGFVTIDSVRQMAFVDLIFNLGANGFSKFERCLAAVERRDWGAAADELMDSKWYTQVGRRGPRIVHMVRTGEMP